MIMQPRAETNMLSEVDVDVDVDVDADVQFDAYNGDDNGARQ